MVAVETFPDLVVWCCPAASKDIIIPPAHVDQFAKRLIQASLVAYYELQTGVGVKVNFSKSRMEDLLDHDAWSTEHSQWRAYVITRHVKLIPTA